VEIPPIRLSVERQLSQSEADELACCFRANSRALFTFACVVTRGDRALAEDLVQQAFQAAAMGWPSLRDKDKKELRSWLRGTLHKLAVSEFRRNDLARRKQSQIEQRLRGPEPDTDRDACTAIALERCWEIINAMPERQHQIALMYWYLDMKQVEIAEELGIAPGTVAAQLHGARKKLLAGLGERDPFPRDEVQRKVTPPKEGGTTP
jgi:RNA polymerase sigma-70 factor (ECF subfamily)